MKKLVIVGAGGLGREVAWLIERINEVKPTWDLIGFVDDNEHLLGNIISGYPVIGASEWLKNNNDELHTICAIGSANTRKKVITKLGNIKFATIIDPKVEISKRVKIGHGCIIFPGTILTVDIDISSHVIINNNCTIGHDAIIKDFVTLYPSVNISGNTFIGDSVEMGTGSQIIQGIKIGQGAIVGAGAVVVRELPDECTAVGCPAKPIKFHEAIKE